MKSFLKFASLAVMLILASQAKADNEKGSIENKTVSKSKSQVKQSGKPNLRCLRYCQLQRKK